MQRLERKDSLIKNYITRDVYPASSNFKALYPLMARTVPKEDTLFGAECELAFIIGPKIGLASPSKHTKRGIIWVCSKETMHRCIIVDDFTREHINEICGSKKGFIPKF
jgi:hypothetical protein